MAIADTGVVARSAGGTARRSSIVTTPAVAVEALDGPGVEPVGEGMTLDRVGDGQPGVARVAGVMASASATPGEGVACAFAGLLGAGGVQEQSADEDEPQPADATTRNCAGPSPISP